MADVVLNEALDGQYREYVDSHIANVKKGAEWLKKNCPELFRRLGNTAAFDNLIKAHDRSKYGPEEWGPYRDYWMGKKWESDAETIRKFREAWKHHYTNNKHHPEYWDGKGMPYLYKLEMLADWMSFGIKNGNPREIVTFYRGKSGRDCEKKNFSQSDKIQLDKMINYIEEVLDKKHEHANKPVPEQKKQEMKASTGTQFKEESEIELLLGYDVEVLNESEESKAARAYQRRFRLLKYLIKFLTEDSLAEIIKEAGLEVPRGKHEKVKKVRRLLNDMPANRRDKLVNSKPITDLEGSLEKAIKKHGISTGATAGATTTTAIGITAGLTIPVLASENALGVIVGMLICIAGGIHALGAAVLIALSVGLGTGISAAVAKRKMAVESTAEIKRMVLDDMRANPDDKDKK